MSFLRPKSDTHRRRYPWHAVALVLFACRTEPPPDGHSGGPAIPPAESAPVSAAPAPTSTATGWNAEQIAWEPYAEGLTHAKAQNKPVCLVFYTTWCPHCRNYSHVFEDPKVALRAKSFVMIHVNADEESDLSGKYQPDGHYIPRTYFLAPDGTLAVDIHPPRPKFLYFYDEHDPGAVLAGMEAALRTLVK
jgi:thiol-disulfide isomerase/thioredoxin